MRGDGRIFQRGNRWWISYNVNGRNYRQPGGDTEADARRLLKSKRNDIAGNRFVPPAAERLTVRDLLQALETDLSMRGAKSMISFKAHRKAVEDYLGDRRASRLTADEIRSFQQRRLDGGKAPATVNRYVETLRAAFRLAAKEEKLSRLPHFPMLREDNVRRGFFEREEFDRVAAALPDPICDVARFAYLTGWRKGEIVRMTWDQLDRAAGEVRLFDSKNGRGRVLAFDEELGTLIEARWAKRTYQGPDGPALSRYVFHKDGHPVLDFRKTWYTACCAAGVGRMVQDEEEEEKEHYEGKLFHDLRRSAVRDMVRAGVAPTVARSISGHRSDEVFSRYDIIDGRDVRNGLAQTQRYRRESGAKGQVRDNVSVLGSGPSEGTSRK
jgi:integrase